jgi:hypothetical protein
MHDIGQNEAFLTACEYAQLIHAAEIANPIDPTGLAQIIGARRVLDILKTIGDPKKEETPKRQGLHYA